MARKFPSHPANPQRLCWGCDRFCRAEAMACGNGSERAQHPVELFGQDWQDWEPGPVVPGQKLEPGGDAP